MTFLQTLAQKREVIFFGMDKETKKSETIKWAHPLATYCTLYQINQIIRVISNAHQDLISPS